MRILLIVLLFASLNSSSIDGTYHSYQCGELILQLELDSTFYLQYTHFDMPYKRISSGKYTVSKDTIIITENLRRFESTVSIDTIGDELLSHKLIIMNQNKLICTSLYCGELNTRQKEHWAVLNKVK